MSGIAGGAPITEFELFLTAAEAYPAFERLCLGAGRDIRLSFRVFDPDTRLRSAEARVIGETWFDLLLDRLDAGVDIDVTLTDFDPILATEDHRRSWASARRLATLAELSGAGRLTFRIALHPARVGWMPRQAMRAKIRDELTRKQGDELTPRLNAVDPDADLPLVPASHHQKLAVIDGEHLYIGGLDLDERRYDTPDHDQPPDQTWHDVQAIVRGPVVAAAEAHLKTFLSSCNAQTDPPDRAEGFLRTLSCRRSVELTCISPRPVLTEIEEAHLDAIARAEGLIYLETQFFRHRPLAEALAKAAQRDPSLSCLLVLPAVPEDVAFKGNRREDAQLGAQKQKDAIDLLAQGFGERVAIAAPAQPGRALGADDPASLHGAPLIYVHSKVSIFGAREAILSSANLNGRSMRWDTEAGLHLTDPAHVALLWDRVRGHWWGGDAPDWTGDAPAFVAGLRAMLDDNAARPAVAREHVLLPYDRAWEERLASPVFGVPDAMV
jgi:phospholipase D1/2